eukprot:scaffold102_cov340-Pavlova_lutheri.AAC.40
MESSVNRPRRLTGDRVRYFSPGRERANDLCSFDSFVCTGDEVVGFGVGGDSGVPAKSMVMLLPSSCVFFLVLSWPSTSVLVSIASSLASVFFLRSGASSSASLKSPKKPISCSEAPRLSVLPNSSDNDPSPSSTAERSMRPSRSVSPLLLRASRHLSGSLGPVLGLPEASLVPLFRARAYDLSWCRRLRHVPFVHEASGGHPDAPPPTAWQGGQP